MTELEKKKLEAFEIMATVFDFKILDDGQNIFLEVGYSYKNNWSFVARRLSRRQVGTIKTALGIKRTHSKRYGGKGETLRYIEFSKYQKAMEYFKEYVVYNNETNVIEANFKEWVREEAMQDLLKEALL